MNLTPTQRLFEGKLKSDAYQINAEAFSSRDVVRFSNNKSAPTANKILYGILLNTGR